MFAAISGLKAHQDMLDVTANDIANVNTVGYKGERTSFKDALSQTPAGASAPGTTLGGTNAPGRPRRPARLDRQPDASGAIQSTGNPFDLRDPGRRLVPGHRRPDRRPADTYYTRAGNFTRDATATSSRRRATTCVGHTRRRRAPTDDADPINIPADDRLGQRRPGRHRHDRRPAALTTPATISLAKFPNERRASQRALAATVRARRTTPAPPTVGAPGRRTRPRQITPGAVEMSNVDLAQEFTNMITAQRGFQANSRVISTADEMLQELVNLKR